jgi:hypothetical protein
MGQAAASSLAASFRASITLTEFSNAFSKTFLPMVLSTKPSTRPLRFLPSRTTTSMSVVPLGWRACRLRVLSSSALQLGI